MSTNTPLEIDRQHIWHPYSSIGSDNPVFHVKGAEGCELILADGRRVLDGMASWWSVIHGYNHPQMNAALKQQIDTFSHVMFGGLTHDPAIQLTEKLMVMTDPELEAVFFSDSGSVSVEVAMKMAIQFWASQGQTTKQRFLTVRNGYHGDTFGAMSVCDPVNGMHSLFADMLSQQLFAPAPATPFGEPASEEDLVDISQLLARHQHDIAAIIIEPVVQGAGGMRFYSADYLNKLRALADEHNVLLIFDEIATGFGRSGKLFAYEHTNIVPDILCLGKALTGGYMTLAATLTSKRISRQINQGSPGVFMHGPTFMANPLACRAAVTSLTLLEEDDWQSRVQTIEAGLKQGLARCAELDTVNEVRVLGAIGVVELKDAVDMQHIQGKFVDAGIWVRPFGKLVYVMPPYVMTPEQVECLTQGMYSVIRDHHKPNA